ncbi:GGDEF domain-containing protein [Brucellaceae bacterium C25G]
MRLPSHYVWKKTIIVALIATVLSAIFSAGVRFILDVPSDAVTHVMRFMLPFSVAIPIGLFWFSRLERLEESYRSAVKRANEMARIASVDPLTGVLNRRSFIEQFKAATTAGVRGWFLIADIDYLKTINDLYGHLVGDDAVNAVAQSLVRILPPDSLIARIGGDEFCAFVPKASCNNIESVMSLISGEADRFLRQKQLLNDLSLSVSVGSIAVKPGQGFEDVMSLSDLKLYRQKKSRENKAN